MPGIVRVGDSIQGHVDHHANHIIGYRTVVDGTDSQGHTQSHQEPIYCSGHDVKGVETSGVNYARINGIPIVVKGDHGTSNCACDGGGFTNTEGSSHFRINGKPVVLSGMHVDIHGHGTGTVKASIQHAKTGG